MRLYEYEGKALLATHRISTPSVLNLGRVDELTFTQPCVLKAQVLFGNRAEKGLIQIVTTQSEFEFKLAHLKKALLDSVPQPEQTLILMEPLVPFTQEWYLAIRYDTDTRLPVVWFTTDGGTGIEDRANSAHIQPFPLTQLAQTPLPALYDYLPAPWLTTLLDTFFTQDLRLLEINPLVLVDDQPVALDAKIELDDNAEFRHPEWADHYPPRSLFARPPTVAEQAAKKINTLDHRGIAGASYFDFSGSIAVLGSGGGASILAMDTLLTTSLKPANYTEYSGNPSREKVALLTELVLRKPNLEGLWVVGGHANFTDQFDTLMGVLDGVANSVTQSQLPPNFPIVVRRGGPRLEEAFAALKERAAKLPIHLELFSSDTPIPDTARTLERLVLNRRRTT